MKQRIRAASAANAFAYALGREVPGVYEQGGRRYNRITVRVTGSITNGYDFESECHIAGRYRVYITSERSRIGY